MAKAKKLSDEELVKVHIATLVPEVAEVVQEIRKIVLGTDVSISERIKWNNPSFYYNGEMKDFDPKEYKREILVLNLHKNRIMLVFPSGAKVNDDSGFLEGNYPDGRRISIIKDLKDLKSRKKILQGILVKWLSLVDR